MKKLNLLVAALLCAFTSVAQQAAQQQAQGVAGAQPIKGELQAVEVPVQYHGLTVRLDEYVEPPGTVNEITKSENLGYTTKDDWVMNTYTNNDPLPNGEDPAWQKEYPPQAPPTKALTQNWDGMGYTGVHPADPSMDVGPNHVVQMINGPSGSYVRIYNKTGTPLTTQTYFDNWLGFPGGAGDPIVMYDERADRWFLSEFSQSGNNLYIAISQTNDPTGAYHTYTFNSPGGFPDYPKYSIWEDAYVMTANVNTPDIFALNRADMLAGNPTTAQMFSQANFGTIGFQASTPVSLNGTTLPPTGQNPLLMRMVDGAWAGSGGTDGLEMWELNIDWATPGNSTLTQVQFLASDPIDSELCGYTSFSCIDQPGSTTNLDPLRELLMNRIMYRNFGSHESIVCCHVTDVSGTDRAGIRWYELRRSTGTAGTPWAIYQQGTYSPDTDSRWMPSIGISATGNIGLAYSVSSASTFPSLRYTGRRECDALGTMTEPETTIIAGTSPNGANRWGDYFQMGTDPSDGETFYHTGCYNVSANWSTRISAFDLPQCSPRVSFDQSTYTVNEPDANVNNGCLDYFVLNVPISIASAPTANADVTVSATGGTATQGVDFDLFNTTHTLAGGSLTGTVEVRVYNDDYVEGAETITLTYTLNANGGDAIAGATNQTVTVTINDDDVVPTTGVTATILSYDFESGFGAFSTVNPSGDTPWQVGNEAAAQTAAYDIPASNTTNFAWINDDACNCNQNAADLIFPSVDLSTYTSAALGFSTYFEDNTFGGNNENADLYVSVNGGADALVGPLTASGVDGPWVTQNFDISAYTGAGNTNIIFKVRYSDATGWLYGCTVDDVLMTGVQSRPVQTAVNTGAGHQANLGPNETVHFYDPGTGNVMMTLQNTSAHDYGCVTVEVDRAGTGAAQFNTAATPDFLHDKTYRVTPTNNNPTGTYNMTLYFQEAEVAGWEAATGNSRANAEIVKVAGNNQINAVNPGNAGTFTITNTAATVGAFNSDVTFTASLNTGFSGFGVGIYNNSAATAPNATFTSSASSVCVGTSITFTDGSSNTPTSWLWDFGDGNTSTAQNPTHTYASNGSFTVTLTATNSGGSDTHTSSITINALPNVSASSDVAICVGASTTISASGANSYSWDNALGSGSSHSVTPATTTTFTVTGTDGNGCVNTDQVVVTVNALPTVNASGTATICNGASTNLSATGATSFSWDNGGGSGATVSVSPSATTTYTVTGTDGNGCTNTDQVTVTVNALPTVSASGTASICNGASTSLSATGATSYSWDNGAGSGATVSVSPSATTTYTVTGTDGNGCVNTDQVTVTVNALPTVSATGTATICSGTSTNLSASGANSYSWDNGAGSGATVSVSPASTTTYTVTGTDGNGCTNTDQVTVTVDPTPSISAGTVTDPTTCGTATGSIVVSGTGTGNVSWTGTATGNANGVSLPYTISGLAAGSYNVTFTSAAGCTSNTFSQALTDPSAPTQPTISNSGPLTFCAGGSVTLTSSYGSGNTWSNSSTTNSIVVSTSGNYAVQYTDGNGCSATSNTITVTVNPNPTVTATGTATICSGSSTNLSAAGANSYSWDNGGGSGASVTVSPASTTTYTVTGTDGNGCTDTDQVTVTVDPTPSISAGTVTNPTSCGTATGSIVVSGTGTGNVSWTGTATGNANGVSLPYTISGLAAGSYNVTFTSAAGCVSNTFSQALTDPSAPAAPTISNSGPLTFCAGGSVTLTSSYGSGNTWSTSATTNSIVVSTSGNYAVQYTDGNGCTATSSTVTVIVNSNPTVTATGSASICSGQSTNLSAAGANSYSWDNGGGSGANVTVSPTVTTTYTVTGTDGNGCTDTDQVTVTVAPDPSITTGTISNPVSCGSATGSIVVTGSGTGDVSWTGTASGNANGVSLPYTITGLAAGSYNITFVNTSGCTSNTLTIPLTDPGAPAAPTISASGSLSLCDGETVTLTSSYASGNTWSTTDITQSIVVSTAGIYSVQYTDGNGCTSTSNPITVVVNALPTVTATGGVDICEGSSTTLTASGADTYVWDNGAGSGASVTVSPTTTTTYTVTGTDANGCDNTAQVTVTVNPVPTVGITPTTIDTMCVNGSGPITLVGNPSGGTFSGPGVSGSVFDPASAGVGTHTITYDYTDGNGCSNTTSVIAVVESCAGIEEPGLAGVELFPNPNEGVFMVTGLEIGTAYDIYDEKGRLIISGVVSSDEERVEIKDPSGGIYYLRATAGGKQGSLKFLITN